jgi:hypothetical protein
MLGVYNLLHQIRDSIATVQLNGTQSFKKNVTAIPNHQPGRRKILLSSPETPMTALGSTRPLVQYRPEFFPGLQAGGA